MKDRLDLSSMPVDPKTGPVRSWVGPDMRASSPGTAPAPSGAAPAYPSFLTPQAAIPIDEWLQAPKPTKRIPDPIPAPRPPPDPSPLPAVHGGRAYGRTWLALAALAFAAAVAVQDLELFWAALGGATLAVITWAWVEHPR